jgi:predicted Rossmann fold flavoprotein
MPRARTASQSSHEADLVVVGAGAAGLWCAQRAAALCGPAVRILVLEKTARTGTKVLASGGTRCNLTTTLDAERAGSLFGRKGARFLKHALRVLPPLAVRERFARWGVPSVEAPLEKVFPSSGRARDVRDALERALLSAGARLQCNAAVRSLVPTETGFALQLASGEVVRAGQVVLAAGGMSYPKTGTTGDGYAWLRALGLPLVAPVPALVPLSSPAPWVRALSGVSLQEVEVGLHDASGRELGRRRRPLLFTHRGVSGPAAMDLSEIVSRARSLAGDAPVAFTLRADLCPSVSRDRLRTELIAAAARPQPPLVSHVLPACLPRRVLQAALASAGWSGPDPRAHLLTRGLRQALIEALKGLPIPIDGTLGYECAEVTAGGLDLSAVDPGSAQVRRYPGLYVCGELLDLQGPIGGLNFQAAFAMGEVAALAVAREYGR